MSKVLALFLAAAKWPLAVVMVLLTPGAARGVWQLLVEVWQRDAWLSPFGLGFALTGVGWALLQRSRFVSFWSTLEHEFTHALFAWLTLVPVHELRSTDGSSSGVAGGGRLHGTQGKGRLFFPVGRSAGDVRPYLSIGWGVGGAR